MRRWVLAAALVATACGGRLVKSEASVRGNLLALTASASRARTRHAADPLVVLVERRGVRAIDPVTAEERWRHGLRTSGHPVASATAVFIPLAEHRLVAVERSSGTILWKVALPGEGLTGLAVSGPIVVVAVIDHRRGRSRLVGISTSDGAVRWMRRSKERFGAPAAVGNVALAPVGDQVVAFGLRTGFERARIDVPPPRAHRPVGAPAYERIAVQGRSLLAGQGNGWIDLRGATAAEVDGALQQVDQGYGSVFARHDGLDPGLGDAERLRLWVDFDATNAGARSAMLLCRRTVLSVRLDPDGRATQTRWAYLSPDEHEFVAMNVGEHRVTLVREDGAILQLSRRSGEELDRIRGGEPVRGALILDADRPVDAEHEDRPPRRDAALHQLAQVVLDDDARLLPAQRLVADLLWRDEDPWVRAAVVQLAQAEVRTESTDAAEALRRHALDLVAGPWGRPDADESRTLLAELARRPSFLDDERPPAAVLARRAVKAGDASMIPHLVDHLLHPGTAAADLPEIVAALDDLDAIDGVATFVRRYHADSQALYESPAILRAVDVLLTRSRFEPRGEDDDEPRARLARVAWTTLSGIVEDPFTEPALRDYIADRLPAPPAGMDAVELVDDDEHELTALSDPGL